MKPDEIFILGKDVIVMEDGGYDWYIQDRRDDKITLLQRENDLLKRQLDQYEQLIVRIESILDAL